MRLFACLLTAGLLTSCSALSEGPAWKRHVIATGYMNQTVIGADFTADGLIDIISADAENGRTLLYPAPEWQPVVLQSQIKAIHSEAFDIDGDGDVDYIGTRYNPGLVFWLENPEDPVTDEWKLHVIDDSSDGGVNGVHGLIVGDVDNDGKLDLIAGSGAPEGNFPNSLAWFKVPADPGERWIRHVFAAGDAPGLNHYVGVGDVNGDGRPDIANAGKDVPGGNWFAWWEQPEDPGATWRKHLLAEEELGASNILIGDVNGDGRNDFVGSRGHGTGLVWFENPSWDAHQINTDLVAPHSLALGDIDGDGDLDAATCTRASYTAAWFENDGQGDFVTHIIHTDQSSYDVRLLDIDGDGDMDLLSSGRDSNNVVWFENKLGGE
jgi:hypothetical protein